MTTPIEILPRDQRALVSGSPGEGARLRGVLTLLAPLMAVVFFAGYLLRAAWPCPALNPTVAAAGVILLSALAAALNWSCAGRLRAYLKGARGEEGVARELALLPAEYRVFHDLRFPGAAWWRRGATCDHVVVGPNGIFVIETKNWSAPVTVENGEVLRLDGVVPDRSPLEQVRQASSAFRRCLRGSAAEGVALVPVLCFAEGAVEGGVRGAGGVMLCRRAALNDMLLSVREERLAPAVQNAASQALQRLME